MLRSGELKFVSRHGLVIAKWKQNGREVQKEVPLMKALTSHHLMLNLSNNLDYRDTERQKAEFWFKAPCGLTGDRNFNHDMYQAFVKLWEVVV